MANLIIEIPQGQGAANASEHLQSQDAQRDLGVIHLTEFKTHLGRRGVGYSGLAEYLPNVYHLVEMIDDDLFGTIARIVRFHNDRTGTNYPHGFVSAVEPDRQLVLSAPKVDIGTKFTLNATHTTYTGSTMLDIASAHAVTKGAGMRIAVVDSGVEPGTVTIKSYHDLLSTASPPTEVDNSGHGTAMATIIHAVAPDAELHVVRVFDKGNASLWDVMAGIAAASFDCKAHIINLSLGFANLLFSCSVCGVAGQSRSKVFEGFLEALKDMHKSTPGAPPPPVFVAATGNAARAALDHPAAFDTVLAVGSVNSKFRLSSFSNHGTKKDRYVLLPGGDEPAGGPVEAVGEGQDASGSITYCLGTSAAAAYATGLLALYWADKFQSKPPDEFIDAVLAQCDPAKIPSHNILDHGKGFLYYH